jgi:hypothetical protein
MGLTQWFGLRKPTDPQAPADLITIVGALADDTDAALNAQLATKADTGHGHAGLDANVRADINALLTFRGMFRAGQVQVPVAANAQTGYVDVTFSAPYGLTPRIVAQISGQTNRWAPFVSGASATGFRATVRCLDTNSGATTVNVNYIAIGGLG